MLKRIITKIFAVSLITGSIILAVVFGHWMLIDDPPDPMGISLPSSAEEVDWDSTKRLTRDVRGDGDTWSTGIRSITVRQSGVVVQTSFLGKRSAAKNICERVSSAFYGYEPSNQEKPIKIYDNIARPVMVRNNLTEECS